MDLNSVIAVVSGVIALLALATGIFTYRRRYPKRAVECDVLISPLAKMGTDNLTFLYKRKRLDSLFIATVRITVRGRADIASSAFDEGSPFVVAFDQVIIGMSVVQGSLRAEVVGNELSLPAQLMHKQDTFQVSLVFDQKPSNPVVRSSLIDIRVVLRDQLEKARRRGDYLWAAGFGAAVVLAAVSGWMIGFGVPKQDVDAMLHPTAWSDGADVWTNPGATRELITTLAPDTPIELICSALGSPSQGIGGRVTWLWYLTDRGWISDADIDSGTQAPLRRGCTDAELDRTS